MSNNKSAKNMGEFRGMMRFLLLMLKNFFKNSKQLCLFLFSTKVDEAYVSNLPSLHQNLREEIRPAIRFGLLSLATVFSIFGLWAGTASLDSAAMANGVVVLSNNRKVVQHPEGGLVEKILVKEGDHVEKDQPLLVLNKEQIESSYFTMRSALRSALAIEARLKAEIAKLPEIDFSTYDLLQGGDAEIEQVIKSQRNILESKRNEFNVSIQTFDKAIDQRNEAMQGYQKQLAALQKVLNSERGRLSDIKALYEKGYATKHQLIEAEKMCHDLEQRNLSYNTEIAKLEDEIEETMLKKANIMNKLNLEISDEYRRNHAALMEVQHKYNYYQSALARSVLRSPASGMVIGLRANTEHGVISPNQVIAEIIPENDDLIIDANVPSIEAIHLKLGMPVKVQLNSFKQRLVPRISGKVLYVSADRMSPEPQQNRPDHFLVKVQLDKKEIQQLNADVRLIPGMPATVFIVRGSRTVLDYLLSPIVDSFHKSFKEQ